MDTVNSPFEGCLGPVHISIYAIKQKMELKKAFPNSGNQQKLVNWTYSTIDRG